MIKIVKSYKNRMFYNLFCCEIFVKQLKAVFLINGSVSEVYFFTMFTSELNMKFYKNLLD